jgi:peptidoglycan/xylan/chitin deacetylase (PgdA/CDA1 family)
VTGGIFKPMPNHDLIHRIATRLSSGFVLAFHELSPQRLAEFVDCLRPAQPVHLGEIVQRSKQRRLTSGLFAITVDDGVGDNVRALSRLFRARQWPATFYLPSRYLDAREGMVFQWWRRLRPSLPRRRLELGSGVIDLSQPGAVEELSRKIERLWHTGRIESYLPMTLELADLVARERGVTRADLQPAAPIAWPEVEELAKNDLIRFESHGVSHAAMSSLTDEELAFEMKYSRDVVSEHCRRQCRHLAYPFGSLSSIGPRAAAAAERFYDSAATMVLGHVDDANPWLLPRIPLYPENSTFRARAKILLKCSVAGRPLRALARNATVV